MSITLFITGIAAPLLMLLSSLSVMSAGLVRDGFGWAAVAKAQKGKSGKAPCPRPRYRLM